MSLPAVSLAQWARPQFPGLYRLHSDHRLNVFFDGPAGSQVTHTVIDAITFYYTQCNANHGGVFETSIESDELVDSTRELAASFLGAPDAACVAFGANMTTMNFALARAVSTQWAPGDEIMVTRLDHDGNVSPWVRAAQDRGVTVKHIDINPSDCTLCQESFRQQLSNKTKLVALGCVSNAVGTRNPFQTMIAEAHRVGAQVALDAVHHAPHLLIDVQAWDCDYLLCSAYKFFGPHVGIMYAKRELLEQLPAYKVRPCAETLPDRWMTGTQNFAAIAGVGAALEYIASIGELSAEPVEDTRSAFVNAYQLIEAYERERSLELIEALSSLEGIKIYGITDPNRVGERVPTIGFNHPRVKAKEVAKHLASMGIFSWSGNFYAYPLTDALGLEPDGMLRVGMLHYNTTDEIDRLMEALELIF